MEVSVDCAKHPQLGEFPPIPLDQASQVQRSGFQSLTRRTIAFAIGAVTCGAVCPVHFLAGRSGRPPDWRLLDNGPALVLRPWHRGRQREQYPSLEHCRLLRSELEPHLEGNHARCIIAAKTDAEQPGGRGRRVGESTETDLRFWFPGYPGDGGRQPEIRMIQDVEELPTDPRGQSIAQPELFCNIEIGPEEIWAAERVSAQIAELARLGRVAAGAGPRGGIDSGNKRIRIEPLYGAWLCHTWARNVPVERHAFADTGELRAAALYDAVPVCRIRRPLHRERHAPVIEERTGQLPAVDDLGQ